MKEVMKTLQTAVKGGMKAYKINGHDTFGFIVTKKGNVLAVNKAPWGNKGITFSLEYKPNCKTGSGCSCMGDDCDFGVWNVTAKAIEDYEKEGLAFARQLKAPMYASAEEWLQGTYWNGRGLEEVV